MRYTLNSSPLLQGKHRDIDAHSHSHLGIFNPACLSLDCETRLQNPCRHKSTQLAGEFEPRALLLWTNSAPTVLLLCHLYDMLQKLINAYPTNKLQHVRLRRAAQGLCCLHSSIPAHYVTYRNNLILQWLNGQEEYKTLVDLWSGVRGICFWTWIRPEKWWSTSEGKGQLQSVSVLGWDVYMVEGYVYLAVHFNSWL